MQNLKSKIISLSNNKKFLALLIIIGGVFGVFAAITLVLNRIEFYKDPNFVPTCSINPWLDCGRVMKSKWAALFGFPNAILGISLYSLALMTGLTMFFNDNLNPKFIKACTLVAGLGFVGNNTLTYISSSIIFSLCPWCLLAHTATTLIFFGLLTYLINSKQLFNNQTQSELWHNRFSIGWNIWITLFYFAIVPIYVLSIYQLYAIEVIKDPFFDPIFWLWDKKSFN